MSLEVDLEEIQIWKKNSTFMYNMLNYHTLDWPTLTCQWLPGVTRKDDEEVFRLVLGTHTANEENKLIMAEVSIKNNNIESREVAEGECKYAKQAQVKIVKKSPHVGDVNRARYMPQNESIIATRSSDNDSFIYKEGSLLATLRGHSDEGYGISWSPHNEGCLLTAGFDKRLCLWDIGHLASGHNDSGVVAPTRVIEGHNDKVEDVSWHPRVPGTFASVGDDKYLCLWDCREKSPCHKVMAHDDDANCVSWHPLTEQLLLTGGSDECVHLWDSRKLVNPLHTFEEECAVYRVLWSPLQETMFLSSGLHRRVHVWDVANIGDDVLSLEEEGGSPELTLVHSGHLEAVTDLDWHPTMKWTVASTSEDNILNLWQINDKLFTE